VLMWAIVMVPVILLDTWLKGAFTNLVDIPIIPVVMLVLSSFTVLWAASYVYLFYRKVVDNDAAPA
jgi:heme/copper-type cytochrome/quinol oxidase subunit 3